MQVFRFLFAALKVAANERGYWSVVVSHPFARKKANGWAPSLLGEPKRIHLWTQLAFRELGC
jgi:hypothetical protein